MATTETLTGLADRFPVGTAVKAYLAAAHRPGGAPTGSALETQSVTSTGTLTYTTLASYTAYSAYAVVAGQHVYVDFMTGPPTGTTPTGEPASYWSTDKEVQDAIYAHSQLTDSVHGLPANGAQYRSALAGGNEVVSLGYNQYPTYHLTDVTDKGIAAVFEGNYDDGSGHNKQEFYVQFLKTDNTQVGVRRPFMSQVDKVTGEITETTVTGGQSLSLRIHDGTYNYPDPNGMVGKQALSLTAPSSAIFGNDSTTKTVVQITGKNDAGNVAEVRFVDGNSAQQFYVGQRATALAATLNMGFGSTEFVRLNNDSSLELRNGSTLNVTLGPIGASSAPAIKLGSDVMLQRDGASSANINSGLSISGNATISNDLRHQGAYVGFYNTTPVTRPVLSYSRGGAGESAAAAAIRVALASTGLIQDSTTA
jgi:hypothetical protein